MKYKLLALDMDGTLLNSNHEISRKRRNGCAKRWLRAFMFACRREEATMKPSPTVSSWDSIPR